MTEASSIDAPNDAETAGITSRSSISEPNIYKNKVSQKDLRKKCSFQSIRSLVKKISFNSASKKDNNSVQLKHSSYKRKKTLISSLYASDATDFSIETVRNEFNTVCDKNRESTDGMCMYACLPMGLSRYNHWRNKVKSKSFKKSLNHFEQRILHMKEALSELLKSVHIKRDICYEHSKIFKDRLNVLMKNVESNIHYYDDLVNDCRELTFQINNELDSLMSVTTFYNEIQRHNTKDSRHPSLSALPSACEVATDPRENTTGSVSNALSSRDAPDNNDVIQIPTPAQWQGFKSSKNSKNDKSKILVKSGDLSQAIIASGILNSVEAPRSRGGPPSHYAGQVPVVNNMSRNGFESSSEIPHDKDSKDAMITSMLSVLYDDVQLVDVALNVRKFLKVKNKVNERLSHIMASRDSELAVLKKLKKIRDDIEDIKNGYFFSCNADDHSLISSSINSHSLKLIPQDSANSRITGSTDSNSSSSANGDRGTDDAAAALECIDDAHIILREERDIVNKLTFLSEMIDSINQVKSRETN